MGAEVEFSFMGKASKDEEYKISVFYDTYPVKENDVVVEQEYYGAELVIGSRWHNHVTVNFSTGDDIMNWDSKEQVLESLVKFRDDVNAAIEKLRTL